MTDRYDQDLLLDYLEGDLDPAQRAQVDRMLADDPQLASLMSALAGDRAALRGMPVEQVPGDLGFDLVQGLERRMLLDAPEVQPSGPGGPIPIQRGHDLAPPTGGVRWGRVVGLTGMAAALAMAAGLVIYFDAFNPLSQTARDLVQQPAAPTSEADLQDSGVASNEGSNTNARVGGAGAADDALEMAAPGGVGESFTPPPTDDSALAELAHQAIRNGGEGAAPGGAPLQPDENLLADIAADRDEARIGAASQQVALTAYAPEQALHIQSDDPDESRQQLLAWCVNNGVPIVEPQLAGATADNLDGPTQQIALLIEKEALDKLVLAMNREQPALRNNQIAQLDASDNTAYLQQARPHALAQGPLDDEGADPEADALEGPPASPALVELRVPEDLGDAVQTRLNVANTLLYSNRSELARTAQREAEVLRNQHPVDPAVVAINEAETAAPGTAAAAEAEEADTHALTDDAGPGRQDGGDAESTRGGGARSARNDPRRAGPGETQDGSSNNDSGDSANDGPGDGTPGPQPAAGAEAPNMQERGGRPETDAEAEGRESADEDAPGVDPAEKVEDTERGNWLLGQVPLSRSTPIWTDPPTAQLVPIVFVRSMLDPEAAPPAEDAAPESAETESPEPAAEDTPALGDDD